MRGEAALLAALRALAKAGPSEGMVSAISWALINKCAGYYGDKVPDTFDGTLSDLLAREAASAFVSELIREIESDIAPPGER